MHGSPQQNGEPISAINVIPLVDISLVLLIIFMVTTAFVKEAGLNMQLPKAQTREASPERAADINIALDAKAQLYLDGKPMAPENLDSVLRDRARRSPESRVIIKADRRIAFDHVVHVIDAVKSAGLYRVALATEPVTAVEPSSR